MIIASNVHIIQKSEFQPFDSHLFQIKVLKIIIISVVLGTCG
jgi:hypothetical protein